MSWSVNGLIGRPEKIAEYLETAGDNLSGQSKEEYEAAKPHLVALVGQNFGNDNVWIKLDASGSGCGGSNPNRTLQVKIESNYGKILV